MLTDDQFAARLTTLMREETADAAIDKLEGYFPGLKKSIVHRQVLTPLDLERQLGITGGHALHGEMSFDQLFTLRPVRGWADYRTPVEGLYLCGAGTHPGGGVTGGAVYGSSDRIGAYPASNPVTPGDLAGTIFWRFGIDPASEVHDQTGRPHRLAAGDPVRRLFAG